MKKMSESPNVLIIIAVSLLSLSGLGSGVDPVLVDPASSLPRTLIRPPSGPGFGQPGSNPNVISIGAVLESQEAIAQFLQVSSYFLLRVFISIISFALPPLSISMTIISIISFALLPSLYLNDHHWPHDSIETMNF